MHFFLKTYYSHTSHSLSTDAESSSRSMPAIQSPVCAFLMWDRAEQVAKRDADCGARLTRSQKSMS